MDDRRDERPMTAPDEAPAVSPPAPTDEDVGRELERLGATQPPPAPSSAAPPRKSPWLSTPVRWVLALGLAVIAAEAAILLLMRPEPPPLPSVPAGERELVKVAVATGEVVLVREVCERYREEHGVYPSSPEAIAASLPGPVAERLRDGSIAISAPSAGGLTVRTTNLGDRDVVFDGAMGAPVREGAEP